jgi:hypothetical protein
LQVTMNTIMNLQVLYSGVNFLTSCENISFSRLTLLHWLVGLDGFVSWLVSRSVGWFSQSVSHLVTTVCLL